jgi:hypothetical protein
MWLFEDRKGDSGEDSTGEIQGNVLLDLYQRRSEWDLLMGLEGTGVKEDSRCGQRT